MEKAIKTIQVNHGYIQLKRIRSCSVKRQQMRLRCFLDREPAGEFLEQIYRRWNGWQNSLKKLPL